MELASALASAVSAPAVSRRFSSAIEGNFLAERFFFAVTVARLGFNKLGMISLSV